MNLFGKILVNQQNFLDQDDETGLNDGEAKRMFLFSTNLTRCQIAAKYSLMKVLLIYLYFAKKTRFKVVESFLSIYKRSVF